MKRPQLPLSHHPVILAPGLSRDEFLETLLLMQVIMFTDGEEAVWRDKWENYTCQLGDVEGGKQ